MPFPPSTTIPELAGKTIIRVERDAQEFTDWLRFFFTDGSEFRIELDGDVQVVTMELDYLAG